MGSTEVLRAIPEPLPTELQKQIKAPSDKWTDDYALRIVRSDWAYAESYRVNAHDWRYRNSDELYLGWVGQRYWEGTRVPRSSLPVYVVFEQVEAMLPKLVSAVSSTDSYNFTADKEGQDKVQDDLTVTAWREMIVAQLGETHWREQVNRALKSMCIYGNGVLEVGFEEYEDEYISFSKSMRASEMRQINHPMVGPMLVPAGMQEKFTRSVKREKKQRPYVRYVSIKDFYVDANCESPFLQDAGYVMKRVYMRGEEVKALKGVKGFKIPDDVYLTNLSKSKSTAQQDVTKLGAELFRYNMWNPALDYTSDPSQKRMAVVEYTTNNRKVWWLQGGQDEQSIIYNEPNRYNEINYYSVGYADVPDRWHALSVSDVAEGEQRLQLAIINSRIDELALALHPPTIKRRGVTVPWYQLKRAPGRVVEVENPENDIKEAEINNITQQAFVEVSASENRVQKITGVTDLAALGAPASGGNSANRTATGVNTQAGATQDRMKYIVENVEDKLIEPVVNAVIRFNRKFMDLPTASNWLKLDSRFANLDPEKVMNTKVSAECRASIKMAGRMGFLQIFPQIAPFIFNPELLQLMAQQNQETINTDSVMRTVFDAINYAPREPWIVQMSQAQKQAMSQPPPEVMAQAQMQQQQIQSDQAINENNLKTKLIVEAFKSFIDHHAQMSELDDKHIQAQMDIDQRQKELAAAPKPGSGTGSGSKKGK